MTTKLEQAAQALLAHWDTPAWKYLKPTGDLMADLREALAEQQTERTQDAKRNVVGLANTRSSIRSTSEYSEQAEHEPVAWLIDWPDEPELGHYFAEQPNEIARSRPLYAAPVRTKDLTDDEIMKINVDTASIVPTCDRQFHFARAVIAADREKNK